MKGLKNLLNTHDIFSVLCAIKTCIQAHDSSVTVHYLLSDTKEYLPSANAEMQWMVSDYGSPAVKSNWWEFVFCNNAWFPSSTQHKRKQELLVELKEWVNAEKKKQGWID